jgi:hypothetical protein
VRDEKVKEESHTVHCAYIHIDCSLCTVHCTPSLTA